MSHRRKPLLENACQSHMSMIIIAKKRKLSTILDTSAENSYTRPGKFDENRVHIVTIEGIYLF